MTDAKPVEVGALVARAIEYHAKMHKINSEICGKFWDVGAAADAQEHADFHQALLAQQAEIARLTQENARLAGEVAELSPKRDEPCDAKGLTRPDKYCRMNRCEREEHGESRCNIMVAYRSLNKEARRDE